jgi:hypothetical protein
MSQLAHRYAVNTIAEIESQLDVTTLQLSSPVLAP